MSSELEEAVKEVVNRGKDDHVYAAAVDMLKSLVLLYGSGWESDVMDVLSGLWSIRGLSLEQIADNQRLLPEAERILSEREVIRVEKRARADLESAASTEERFYTTSHLYVLLRLFAADREIDRYRYEVSGWMVPPKT